MKSYIKIVFFLYLSYFDKKKHYEIFNEMKQ